MPKFIIIIFIIFQMLNFKLFGLVKLTQESHPYSHGSGYGFAIEMINDPIWMQILQEQEPFLFLSSNEILTDNENVMNFEIAKKVMLLMENSPVIAAYARSKIGSSFIPELDVWISPNYRNIPGIAKIVHGNNEVVKIYQSGNIPESIFYTNILGTDIANAYSIEEWFSKYIAALQAANLKLSSKEPKELLKAVCLEIKSAWSNAKDVAAFVKACQKKMGIKVEFVGAFDQSKLSMISSDIKTIIFFSAIWELELAAHTFTLPKCVMFNGADLLIEQKDFCEIDSNKQKIFKVNLQALEKLDEITKVQNVQIGIYVQETDIQTQAVQVLIDLIINKKPELFKLGFAFGGNREGQSPHMIYGRGDGSQVDCMSDKRN